MKIRFVRFIFAAALLVSPLMVPSQVRSDPKPYTVIENGDKDIPVYNWGEFEKFLSPSDDTVYVINFWATWCAPCVQELPGFEEVHGASEGKQVRVMLVSLDLKRMWDTHLVPFINDRKIKSKVVVLYEVDANKWIDQIDEEWSGSIPATLFIKGSEKQFHEGQLTKEEIESYIDILNAD